MKYLPHQSFKAFTQLEWIIIVVILLILAAILIPLLQRPAVDRFAAGSVIIGKSRC